MSLPLTLGPPVIMATLPWSLLFEDVECVLSLLREELESDVRREKKSIKEVRGERKLNKKHYFGFSICVCTVANLQRYGHKCQIFATFKTSAVRCFLVCQIFGIWHIYCRCSY